MSGYDVEALRAHFPSLAGGTAYFDGPGGTQTPDVVGDAMRATITAPLSNRGDLTPAERNADAAVVAARSAVADLTRRGARGRRLRPQHDPADVRPGPSAGQGVEARRRGGGHPARPRRQRAALGGRRRGPRGRGALGRLRPGDCRAGPEGCRGGALHRTRLVACTAASNLLGTRPDLPAIAADVHAAGALLYVDGVHHTAHVASDVVALGADFYGCSPYKFLGPHCGVVVADPALFETCTPTSWRRRPTPCRSASSSARCPTS